MDDKVNTHETENIMQENAKNKKQIQKEENNRNNAQTVRTAAGYLSKTGGVTGAIGKGIQIADKYSNGKASEKLGKMTTRANRFSGLLGKKIQGNTNKLGSTIDSNNTGKENSTDSPDTNSTLDNKADVKIKMPIRKLFPFVLYVALLLAPVFIIGFIIFGGEGYRNSGSISHSGSSLHNSGYYNVDDHGNIYIEDNVSYLKEDGTVETYSMNKFIAGVLYNLLGDMSGKELYNTYAVLTRTQILANSDSTISSEVLHYSEYNGNQLNDIVDETNEQFLITDSGQIPGINIYDVDMNSIKNLVSNSKDYKEIIDEIYQGKYKIYGVNYYIPDDNPSDDPVVPVDPNHHVDMSISDTTKGNYLKGTKIDDFLRSNGSSLANYNEFIKAQVAPYRGTSTGVVKAAVAAIKYLYSYNKMKFPYYWGGKHLGEGLPSNFGQYREPPHQSRSGHLYYYVSFDCSGFVQWAIYNGGFKDPGTGTYYLHQNYIQYGCRIVNSNCVGRPGDLINAPSNHVQLILSVDSSHGIYYIAESSGNGVAITTRKMHTGSDYYILHMDNFYRYNRR